MHARRNTLLVGLLLLPSAFLHADSEDDGEFFRQQIAPILEAHCYQCHNTDVAKGDFALDTAAGMLESGFIEAGDSDSSYLLELISASQGQRPAMPKDGEPLTDAQIKALQRWINGGAVWPDGLKLQEPRVTDMDWWSLQPLVQPSIPDLPATADQAWLKTPIDAFILAALNANNLTPSPPADRRTLIRRLYFDLIGLPPTPEQVATFVADDDPLAYERLVTELLDSPHYGERWARHWLDVVQYADTCGYDKDKLRPNAWPYRDYVIRSFNEDKPYGRFVQEQIAGDVLFPGNSDGIQGLGFLAAGPWDFIGHVEVPESKIDGKVARNIDRDDMVTNTLNALNSVTIQCARCHNHKFDPFTQEHYYRLQAVFAAVDRADRPYDLDPSVEQQRRELNAKLADLGKQRQTLDDQIRKDGGDELAGLDKRIGELKPRAGVKPKNPAYGYHSQIEKHAEQTKWVQVDLGRTIEFAQIVLRPCHDEYAGIGGGFGFPVRFRVEASDDPQFSAAAKIKMLADRTQQDVPNPQLTPFVVSATGVKSRYLRVTATRLAPRSNDYIFALAELDILDAAGHSLSKSMTVTALDSIEAPVRWARQNLTDGIWPAAGDEAAARELAAAERDRQELLDRINTPRRRTLRESLDKKIEQATTAISGLPEGKMVYAAATHFKPQGNFRPTEGQPRPIHMLHRGNVLEPRHEVSPGTLPIMPAVEDPLELPPSHSEGDRRAALARWLTRPDHPLTWRSIVNRVWLYHFGRGLVETPNDFGRMGQLPSHPALLDWLACEFRDSSQSLKPLHRLIVTSAVYRQASAFDADKAAIDADNRFLWRMNRRRLEAEEVRDAVLMVSGKLDRRMYGPGYYLFALEKTDHSPHYEYHKHDPEDPASHRRAVYRFIARSQPDPFMTTLDCADSSQSTPRRNETLTSLQALSLLNNKFTLAMSKHFASRLTAEAATGPEQIRQAMQRVAGREPTTEELQAMLAYAEQFGLANLCRVLFNLSEFTYLD